MIFQSLIESNKVKLVDSRESGHVIGTTMRLINDGPYADAKLFILYYLQQQHQVKFLYAS